VAFRPNLLAAASFDGSIARTIRRTVQATLCDNTLAVAQWEKGQTVKIRHSSGSLGRITSVRQALSGHARKSFGGAYAACRWSPSS
jgi:poly-beta-hydroxyalkanoate depolymerase